MNLLLLGFKSDGEIDGGMECGTKYIISFYSTPFHPSLINKEHDAFICVKSSPYKKPLI